MRYFGGAILPLFAWSICQAGIVTVTDRTSRILSDTDPTTSYTILEAPLYYPLSVQGEKGRFYRVRDYQGRVGWVEKSKVSKTKGVVIDVARANIRKGPGTTYPVVFKAYKGVSFKVVGEKNGWLQVVHESGKRGWVSKPLSWGQ